MAITIAQNCDQLGKTNVEIMNSRIGPRRVPRKRFVPEVQSGSFYFSSLLDPTASVFWSTSGKLHVMLSPRPQCHLSTSQLTHNDMGCEGKIHDFSSNWTKRTGSMDRHAGCGLMEDGATFHVVFLTAAPHEGAFHTLGAWFSFY